VRPRWSGSERSSAARSNADPLAILQIGFASDGDVRGAARYVFLLMGRPVSTTSEFPNQSVRPIGGLLHHRGWVMVTKQLSIAIAIAIGTFIGAGVAQSDLQMFAAAQATETKIDFDRVFADATRHGEFNLSIQDGLRYVGRNFIMATTHRDSKSLTAGYVERVRKSDRWPNLKSVLPDLALLPYCEPIASPFADPVLARIVGRCDA
jgi:hypothetical protein